MKGKEKQMQRLSGANCKCRLSGVIGTWSTMHWMCIQKAVSVSTLMCQQLGVKRKVLAFRRPPLHSSKEKYISLCAAFVHRKS
eukprot:scaffold141505_cov19-Tisochrysis_lutea.AAC.1